jgi:hypothetical protein
LAKTCLIILPQAIKLVIPAHPHLSACSRDTAGVDHRMYDLPASSNNFGDAK